MTEQKAHRAQKSGARAEDIEHASWKFHGALDFLSSTAIPTPSVNNFNKSSLHYLQSSSHNEKTEQSKNISTSSCSSRPSSRASSPLAIPLQSTEVSRISVFSPTQLAQMLSPIQLSQTPAVPSKSPAIQQTALQTFETSEIPSPLSSPVVATSTQRTNATNPLHPRKRKKPKTKTKQFPRN